MDKRFYNIYNNNEQLESKRFGEVYTPEYIVKSMVDKIPDEVWNNKNIKVLDFACGCGIFAFFIYKKLIQYFDHDYVMNNVLYFNDVQEKNINKIKYIFNNPKNIYQGDFLEWKSDIKFDVIIGNPPFQAHEHKKSNGNAIWHKFVDKLLILLKYNRYLSLIHPPGWRKPATSRCKYTHLYKELTQKRQMMYLEIYEINEGKNIFNCETRFDIYLVENVKPYKNTSIIDGKNHIHKINLLKWPFIPNHSFKLISNLLKCDGEQIKILHNNQCDPRNDIISDICDDKYKYPVIHSIVSDGVKYKYSSVNNVSYFGVSKVIWNEVCFQRPFLDENGIYGLSPSCIGIEIKNIEHGEKIMKCFKGKKIKLLMDSLVYSSYRHEFRIFNYFKHGIWDEFLKDD